MKLIALNIANPSHILYFYCENPNNNMNQNHSLPKADWEKALYNLVVQYNLYAPIQYNGHQDYELIHQDNIAGIIYNIPKPVTPLKKFFLPIKENVVNFETPAKKQVIMGIPSCDLTGVNILDEIYLDEEFVDPTYKKNRDNSILIGTDCHSTLEHCHCTTYGVSPTPTDNHDITLSTWEDTIYLNVNTEKGKEFINELNKIITLKDTDSVDFQNIINKRKEIEEALNGKNSELPGYKNTGELIDKSSDEIWKKHSDTCVSCGACATICPTCTCFLLIDKPGFEKVRHVDACQYPGFERVAAGEDPLKELFKRFRNRYLCKYVLKPKKFKSIACTGCGRCIEACIAKINKNELFLELKNQ